MIGSNGPRMLRIAVPYVDSWNSWFSDTGNRPDGVPALRTLVDDACRETGRAPGEVERTLAVLVQLPGGTGRMQGGSVDEPMAPLQGSPAAMADALRAFGREGITHVQLVLDPITIESIRAMAPVLDELDRG
jgi:alkanesulfonate monooxygenase SsuD/methylene tetrahydromethanopterin reductase-like flavin-dependent oxidoreductase (luciferase family)